jgi:hypothetical protein
MTAQPSESEKTEDDANIVRFPATQNPANRPAPSPPEEGESLSIGALVGIGVFLAALVVAGLWLMDSLRDLGKMQDCAMQGRRNCAEIAVPGRDR